MSAGVMVAVAVLEGVPRVKDCDGLSFDADVERVSPETVFVLPVAEAVAVSAGVIVLVSVPESVGLVPEADEVSEPLLFVSVVDTVGCVREVDAVGVPAGVTVCDCVFERELDEEAVGVDVAAGVMVCVDVPEPVFFVDEAVLVLPD